MTKVQVDKFLYEALLRGGVGFAIEFAEARALKAIILKGVPITPELRSHIAINAVTEVRKLTADIRAAHLSSTLNKLLEAKSKKEALKIIDKELVLDHNELFTLISNPHLFGFEYRRKHKEFIPKDLRNIDPTKMTTKDGKPGEMTDEGKKVFRQITQIFKTRRQLNVHWFQFGIEWHCFYFDFGDLLRGHWVEGDHVHYISHLWGKSSDEVWNSFDKNESPSRTHIRFRHDLRNSRGSPWDKIR